MASVELYGVIFVSNVPALEHARRISQVKLLCLPRQQAFLDLVGEAAGISGGTKSFARQDAGRFMVAVAIARGAAGAGRMAEDLGRVIV